MMQSVAIVHLHRVEHKAVAKALDQVLAEWKYRRSRVEPLTGPPQLAALDPGVGQVCYLLGPRRGNWITLIQAFADRDDAPFLADVSNRLSQQLQTHSLAILFHEGEVLFYNLDYRGTPRDGYSSNPQHFADQKLTPEEATRQRHQPKAFTPLLPKQIRIEKLMHLLDAGWWHAHDAGQLDETGDPLHEDALIDEEERLAAFGGMLQLNGPAGYPFARWRTTTLIDWKQFQALHYQAKGRSLQMV